MRNHPPRTIQLERLENRLQLATIDLVPVIQFGSVFEEGGTVVSVTGGTQFTVSAELTFSEVSVTGYQLNFQTSDNDIALSSWASGDSFGVSIDSDISDRFVAAVGLDGATSPPSVSLGTFTVDAPTTPGDYVLSLEFTQGNETEVTLLSDSVGGDISITDFGDLTVRVSNSSAPTISQVDDENIDEDTSTSSIAFTIDDPDTNVANLEVTVTTDDDGLFPPGNILLSGTGNQRFVQLQPALDQNGTAEVTVSVSDGENVTLETFMLTVNPQNDPPTGIQLAGSVFDENELGAVVGQLTVIDPDQNDTFSYTLSDDRFEVVNHQLKLKLSAALNFEVDHPLSIDITAKDSGDEQITVPFQIDITNLNDAPIVTRPLPDLYIKSGLDQQSIHLPNRFADEDIASSGDFLTFSIAANSNPSLVSTSLTNGELLLEFATDQLGSALITVRATDAGGKIIESSFTIYVSDKSAVAIHAVPINQTKTPGFVQSSVPEPQILHEWQKSVVGVWIEIGIGLPNNAFDLTVDIEWDQRWFEEPTVSDVIGVGSSTETTNTEFAAVTSVTLEGVDLSGFQIGQTVLLANLSLSPITSDPVGVAANQPGHYPEPIDDVTLGVSQVLVDAENLNVTPTTPPKIAPVIFDSDENGQIGLPDFSRFVARFGLSPSPALPEVYLYDFDRNGTVGLTDFVLFVTSFGYSKPLNFNIRMPSLTTELGGSSAATIEPEPSSLDIEVVPELLIESEPTFQAFVLPAKSPDSQRSDSTEPTVEEPDATDKALATERSLWQLLPVERGIETLVDDALHDFVGDDELWEIHLLLFDDE